MSLSHTHETYSGNVWLHHGRILVESHWGFTSPKAPTQTSELLIEWWHPVTFLFFLKAIQFHWCTIVTKMKQCQVRQIPTVIKPPQTAEKFALEIDQPPPKNNHVVSEHPHMVWCFSFLGIFTMVWVLSRTQIIYMYYRVLLFVYLNQSYIESPINHVCLSVKSMLRLSTPIFPMILQSIFANAPQFSLLNPYSHTHIYNIIYIICINH